MRHPRPRRIHLDAANTMQLEWSSGRDRSFARQLLKLILDHWRARKRKEKSKLKCLHLVPDRVSFYASFLLSERCSILRSLRSVSLFIFERTLVKQFPLFFFFFFFSFSFFSFLALLLDGFQIRELALFSRRRNNTTIDISIALLSFFCFVYSHMQMYSQLALYIIRIDIAALACYQRYHDFIASTCVRARAYFQINIFINVIHYFAWNFADDSLQIPNIMKISHVRNIIRNVTFRTNIVAGAITASCYHVTSFIQRDLYIPYVMLNVKWMGFRRQVDGTRSNKILYSCFTDTTLTDRPIDSVASPFETLLPLFGTYRWLTPSIHLLLVCRLFFVRLSVVSCLSSFIY